MQLHRLEIKMTLIQSVFLGIIQGITEFLPVSSSGHLSVLRNFFGIQTSGGLLFDVMLHLGTVIAIIIVFRKDVLRMIGESIRILKDLWDNASILIHNRKEQDAKRYKKILHNNYRRFVVMVLCSTIPTAVIGYAARDLVSLASNSLLSPGIGFILTAIFLIIADVSENGKKIPKDISFTSSFLIGIAQGISTLPGLSRSGTTIAACLISGYDKRFAVKYSFIMAIPAILGAVCLEIGQIGSGAVSISQFFIYLAGAVTAGIVGYFSCRKMLSVVRKKKFRGFAIYCLILGSISIIGYMVMR